MEELENGKFRVNFPVRPGVSPQAFIRSLRRNGWTVGEVEQRNQVLPPFFRPLKPGGAPHVLPMHEASHPLRADGCAKGVEQGPCVWVSALSSHVNLPAQRHASLSRALCFLTLFRGSE